MNAQPKCNRCGQPGYTHGNYSDCITYLKTRVALADSEAVAGTNRAERAEARVAELEAQLAAAQPAIEAWAQYQADNERRAQLQEDMIAEGLIKRPYWQ